MNLYLLLAVGCAECSGGDGSLIGHRSVHSTEEDAKNAAFYEADIDPLSWTENEDVPGSFYVGNTQGYWEILRFRVVAP